LTLGVALGLGSGLCWGAADFFGGLQSRRLAALAVVLWGQVAGALLLAAALALQGRPPTAAALAWGFAAGAAGGSALLLFYRGLAEGAMSVVAPVAACGALVPVVAAAVTGVVLVSRSPDPGQHPGGRPERVLALALGAALGFGLYLVLVDAGTATPGASPLWVVAGGRAGSLLLLSVIALTGRRSRAGWPGRRAGAVALVGVADTTANLLFALAATTGNLAVVGVLGSLYPVATVLLARVLLRERLSTGQNAGVVLALTGVGLLAAG
jgi:drug/metabolite transporter (DMT)-like permease